MGDVVGGSHPPGGYGREVGAADFWCDACVALDRDKARRDGVDSDPEGGELPGPASALAPCMRMIVRLPGSAIYG